MKASSLHGRKKKGRVKPWRHTEREEILLAVNRADGDMWLAAALLGVGRTTVYRKLKAYGRKKISYY